MAFYTRTIEIDGVIYKQISAGQWQNVKTGQVIDGTKMVYIINEFKSKKGRGSVQPITPGGGASGACCEIPNMISGAFICTEKDEGSCPGGCFKSGQKCDSLVDGPEPCDGCVRCCYIADQYCVAKKPEQCVPVGNGGGTYFGSNGCTACKYGVCSSDQNNNTTNATERFYGSRGCTGTFIVGGGVSDFRTGVFCTGSGVGQTCFGPGMQYQALTPHFIQGGTCADCILGACCTGGSCAGITSQSACSALNGLFFAGQTCGLCDFGVFCTGLANDRICIRTGYRGEVLSNQFQSGATCSYCIMGTCCKANGDKQVGVRESDCMGTFFPGVFNQNACDTGSCCLGGNCTENILRNNCFGVFNNGMNCSACSSGACCTQSGCTLVANFQECVNQNGVFYGGATCSACDTGVCCVDGNCNPNIRRGDSCEGTFYSGIDCSIAPCELGICCTGGNCLQNRTNIECSLIGGEHFQGATCSACDKGSICYYQENEITCYPDSYRGSVDLFQTFYLNQGCSACEEGACCNQNGGGVIGIRGDCISAGTSFFAGQTLSICDPGVFCTGSNEGQTCFGLGYRGQSLTNNFIRGATCNSCILGACCTGGTCLGGGLTSQAACNSAGGLFFAGRTCTSCDYGVFCTGATCLSLGYRGQSLSNNFIIGATCSSCILGACCTGGTCSAGGQTSQAACNGLFYPGATCRSCDYGVYCTGATCFELGYRAQNLTNNFIQGATCDSCILGACCTGGTCLGGGQTSQAACSIVGGTFYVGATCTQCVTGVFCTGSGIGQTCFGLGNRGQSLTNNFIAGATCSSCILGACCTGGTCLGGGLTSQAACSAANGLFYAGTTCVSCDYGVFCTGSDENKTCFQPQSYRAQNLTNEFIVRGGCIDCVFGVCCQGSTCLGITSEASCNAVEGSFIAGATCSSCSSGITGICCTGAGSIQTIEDCTILGGHWFASGTTALCVTGGCCTGGTCIEEIVGKSGNCQLFIAGSTCGICDTGVFCTGPTCLQVGFRGQSLTSNFIVGATCNSCILGICCTGGTCIGNGQTAEINCPPSVGIFISGATQCNACEDKINCCVGGTCSYILLGECAIQGGIAFVGAQNCSLCDLGVFCDGRTCTNAGITFRGFSLTNVFLKGRNCGDCIQGTCCYEESSADQTQNDCRGQFNPGSYNPTICRTGFGICCVNGECTENVEQSSCSGYFVSDELAALKNISCSKGACKLGPCCGETDIQSVTGGTCFGIMSNAECAFVTGGEFFASEDGYSCSNCLYIPMLASAVVGYIYNDANKGSEIYGSNVTGFTGNEIFPRKEIFNSTTSTWLTNRIVLYGPGGASLTVNMKLNNGHLTHVYNILQGFTAWFNGKTASYNINYSGNWQGNTGIYDFSPIFGGATLRQKISSTQPVSYTFGYIDGFTYESPRYARLTYDYNRPDGIFYNKKPLVYRHSQTTSTVSERRWSLTDATNHAELNPTKFNFIGEISPYRDTAGSNTSYGTPVLVQLFAENPLKYRVRPAGSCCVGATCIGIVTKDICQLRGGTFNENKRCDLCYPELIKGNCCTGGSHAGYTTQAACIKLGGVFFLGSTYIQNICDTGTICREDKTCFEPAFRYFGEFQNIENRYFVRQDINSFEGCTACKESGLCCVGATCMGIRTRTQCAGMSGTFYPDENVCETNCEFGICCNIDGGCGTYTQRANCTSAHQVFISGTTQGQTCNACSSLLKLTHAGNGVTYTFVLNKGTTYGTFYDGTHWVQESNDLKLLKIRTIYRNLSGLTFAYGANTRIPGLTLRQTGFKGSVHIHGCVKNPLPQQEMHPTFGYMTHKQSFSSITYSDYSEGWVGGSEPDAPGSTDVASNYEEFDLNEYNNVKNQFKFGTGLTMQAADVFMIHTGNFDITNFNISYNHEDAPPYYLVFDRGINLSFGILNCLSAQNAAFAGSTVCFRPPNSWPAEKRSEKPIYPISNIEGKIPGQSGNPLVILSNEGADLNVRYDSKVSKICSQASEFGDGTRYNTTTPMWSMAGDVASADSYGEQFIAPLQKLLTAVHATGANVGQLTHEQRKDGIIRITQYGLDSWGAQKSYSVCMGSGAGQKAGRTRGWIPIAGYYLGVTSMYDPEDTMRQDTARFSKFLDFFLGSVSIVSTGISGTCATEKDWKIFRFGGTGPENNYKGYRKMLGAQHAHDVSTMFELINNPSNPIMHYEYPGAVYKITISGFGTTGPTGITFYNEYRLINIEKSAAKLVNVEGNFGVIKWGQSYPNSKNPLPSGALSSTTGKAGTGRAYVNMGLRVESGPGSSGPGGKSRMYKILFCTGFRNDTVAEDAPGGGGESGGGWQMIIGQTWADGIPDHTSTLKVYPFTDFDGGVTRPDSFSPSGFTYCPVIFLIKGVPGTQCGSPINSINYSSLYDGSPSSMLPYFGNSLDAWLPQYMFSDYIMKTKGITLISDIAPIPDYVRQFIYTSPYNIASLHSWYTGTDSVLNTWIGTIWSNDNLQAQRINFSRDFPGVKKYNGITV